MKTNIRLYIKVKFLLVLILLIGACDSTQETYEKFVEGGEDIVVSKPLSVTIHPGNQRANFIMELNADPKIKQGVIEWLQADNVKVVHEFDILRDGDNDQIIEVPVTNIDEGIRIFNVMMKDASGRVSLPTEESKQIYGSVYSSDLQPRSVVNLDLSMEGVVTIDFSENLPSGINKTIIEYTDVIGNNQQVTVDNEVNSLILDSASSGTIIKIHSIYKPIDEAIDTFNSRVQEHILPTDDL